MSIQYECLTDKRTHRLKTQISSLVAYLQKPLLPAPNNPFIFLSIRSISLHIKGNCYLIFNSLKVHGKYFLVLILIQSQEKNGSAQAWELLVTQASLED